MSIVLARVDNRLIHGQILESWVPYVRANYIVVVDDDVANDSFRRLLMTSVVPSTIKIDICSQQQLISLCHSSQIQDENTLVLFANPASALRAYRNGCRFRALNLGNMHVGTQKCCISNTLYMDSEDMHNLELLVQFGVDISAQCVPTDRALHWDCQRCALR